MAARRRLARLLAALLAVPLLVAGLRAAPAGAADWGGIEPGVTTMAQVRERYGAPTRETPRKLEGYDTVEWLYESAQAPVGFIRMTVDFGVLLGAEYKASVVRVFRLDPKPLIFARNTVIEGWGRPDAVGDDSGREVYFYLSGLLVTFEPSGVSAVSMYFTPPQPKMPEAGSAPAGPPVVPRPAPPPVLPPAPAPSRR